MPHYRTARLTLDGGRTYALTDVSVEESYSAEFDMVTGGDGRMIGRALGASRTRLVIEAEAIPTTVTVEPVRVTFSTQDPIPDQELRERIRETIFHPPTLEARGEALTRLAELYGVTREPALKTPITATPKPSAEADKRPLKSAIDRLLEDAPLC